MNKLQYVGYSTVGTLALALNTFAAADGDTLFGSNKVSTATGADGELTATVQSLITGFLAFLGVVAVCFAIYAGFLMTTAGGDEEKVKKGRTIMIQVGIGLIVIFLANSIVRWFISLIAG